MGLRRFLWAALLGGGLVLGGCGDDDGDDMEPDDAGEGDTGMMMEEDAGSDAGPPEMDAGMDAGPMREECDPYTEDSCDEGKACQAVIEEVAPEEFEVYFGCVEHDERLKGEGVVCSRGVDATPDDGTDNATTDNCRQGLFCWRAPGMGFNTCQRLCGAEGVDCEVEEYCRILNSEPRFGTCTAADDCDPVFQTGCGDGEGCYLVSNTMGDLLGSCFEFSAPDGGTGEPGEECMFIDTCQPGTQCFPEFYPDGGASDDFRCRNLCNAGGTDAGMPDAGPTDGGMPDAGGTDAGGMDAGGTDAGGMDAGGMDAGGMDGGGMDGGGDTDAGDVDAGPTFTGACESPMMCVDIPVEDGTAMVPTNPGICL